MELSIKTLPIDDMRWNGLGDYYPTEEGKTQFYIAETGNELYNRFIAIHELVENTLMMARGIAVKTIDDYCDRVYASGGYPDSNNIDSPIYMEHAFADIIEYLTALECGIKRKDYNDDLDKILNSISNIPKV